MSRNKIIIIAVLVAVFAGIVFLLWPENTNGKVKVNIIAAPQKTKITLNGKGTKTGEKYLLPGEYTVKGEYEGFETHEFKTSVVLGVERDILIALVPITPEAEELVRNDTAVLEIERSIGDSVTKAADLFLEKNPIVAFLPYSNPNFRIDYSLGEDENTIYLLITAVSDGTKNLATEKIRDWGFNILNYKVVYRNWAGTIEQ